MTQTTGWLLTVQQRLRMNIQGGRVEWQYFIHPQCPSVTLPHTQPAFSR